MSPEYWVYRFINMPHILIIEDDPKLGPMLERSLQYGGYRTTLARNGKSGLEMAMSGSAHLLILDLMLPFIDGLHILNRMRKENITTPVVILTAKGEESERLEGFRAGCDDYITKPFSLAELQERIKAVLRRSGYSEQPAVIHSAGLTMDPGNRSAIFNNRSINLSHREFDLLYALASRPNQALSRRFLLEHVWGDEIEVTTRAVDTRIASIRNQLEKNPDSPERIITVYKVGYMWKGD